MRGLLKTTITVLALAAAMLLPAAALGQNDGDVVPPDHVDTSTPDATGSVEATGSEEATDGESLPFTEGEESTGTTGTEDGESLPFTGGGETALAFASVAGAAGYLVRRFASRR